MGAVVVDLSAGGGTTRTGARACADLAREQDQRNVTARCYTASMPKRIFTVERTAEGIKCTPGLVAPAPDLPPRITRQRGSRIDARAALEEGTAWFQEAANLGSTQVEVTIEW